MKSVVPELPALPTLAPSVPENVTSTNPSVLSSSLPPATENLPSSVSSVLPSEVSSLPVNDSDNE